MIVFYVKEVTAMSEETLFEKLGVKYISGEEARKEAGK